MTNELFLKNMGQRISTRRKALKLTQETLAEAMNVSVQMISNLEQGKKAIRPDNLAKLSTALQISTDYILKGETTDTLSQSLCTKIYELPESKLELVNEIVDLCLNSKP